MTSTSEISAAIKTRMESIAGIGRVYDMLGNPVTEADFKTRYADGDKILAWEITREGSQAVDLFAQAVQRTQMMVIHGYMSFQDGVSEAAFKTLLDAICDAFDPISLRRFEGLFDFSGPLQIDGPKFAMKGNYLVHYVRMSYPVVLFPIT